MTVFVGHDVGLGSGGGLSTKLLQQGAEEVRVEVDHFVRRAVERPSLGVGVTTPGARRTAEWGRLGLGVALDLGFPVLVDAGGVGRPAAVGVPLDVGSGTAARHRGRRVGRDGL